MNIGTYIILGLTVTLLIALVCCAVYTHKAVKMQTALKELNELPLDEWEKKWAEFVQNEYNKTGDPHRAEVEAYMEFFKKCREEIKEGGEE